MKNESVIIELSPLEAQTFITFQKHRALIGLLESIKAFDIRSGSVTIHFSRLGEIVSVEKHEHFSPNMIQEVIHT